MARKPRVEFAGATYHVMCRGNREEAIFSDIHEENLPILKKGDDWKKVIAWYIRKNTSVRVDWITRRLKMGVTSNFSCYIRAVEQSKDGLLWELKNKITN